MKVPILILTNNRPTMLSDMITSIESYTDPETYKIIICDNNSQQKEMLELLDTLEKTYTVIRNDTNNTFEGLNPGLKIVKNFHDKYFIISDPDIILNSNIPSNWVTKMCELLDKTNYPKVGLSLNISFENINNWTNFIITTEKRYWKKECKVNFEFLEADCYEALVDTTMAMYRHDTFTYWTNEVLQFDRDHGIVGGGWIHLGDFNPKYKDIPLRIGGNFTCEHVGWWLNKKYLKDFPYYYINSIAKRVSSSFQKTAMTHLINTLSEEELKYILEKININSKKEFIRRLN